MTKQIYLITKKKDVKILAQTECWLKYKIPKKFIHSPVIHTFFGYKLKKNKMHNAIHDCLNVLKALKKVKFIL